MRADFHVLVPLKRFDGAKSRLAGLLTHAERGEVVQAMLADVLGAIEPSRGVSAITLVSSEPAAPSLAGAHGVGWWDDRGLPWNRALLAAMHEVVTTPSVAVISADIPLATSEDVEALLGATPAPGVAIARATDGGTNAVAMTPPAALGTCFGLRGSAALHAKRAEAAGLDAVIVDRPGIALDLDTPADVERFLAVGRETRTAAILAAAAA